MSERHGLGSDEYEPHTIARIGLGGLVEGKFVHAADFDMQSITIGPRLDLPLQWGLTPFGAFLVGFERIHNTADDYVPVNSDDVLVVRAGAQKKLSLHFNVIGRFDYTHLPAQGGEYNPKNFSVGGAYHFRKR